MSLKHLILGGLILFALGLIAGRIPPRRLRLAWVVPLLVLFGLAAFLVVGRREDSRQAAAFFARLETSHPLTAAEADVFRALSTAPPRVREQVVGLAFASSTNAAIALPRLGFLLHCCVEIEPSPGLPEKLWQEFAVPAIQKSPSLEVLRLAAATADFLRLGTNAVQPIADPLLVNLQNEPNSAARLVLIRELMPLSDRMQPAQNRILADNILLALPEEKNLEVQLALAAGLMTIVNQFDSQWAQRIISQTLPLMETNRDSALSAGLVVGLVEVRGQMDAAQLQRLAQALAQSWLDRGGAVRPKVMERLTELVKILPPEVVEQLVRSSLLQVEPHSYSIFYQTWTAALGPFLRESAMVMGGPRTAAIVSGYFGAVREPWVDILWGRWIGSMLSGRPPQEAEPLARQLLDKALLAPGQPRTWFVERFSALAARLDPEPARSLVDLLVQRLAEAGDSYEFEALSSCVVALGSRLEAPAANQLAQCLLAMMEPEKVTEYLSLARAFEPLAARLEPATAQAATASFFAAMNRGRNVYRLSLLAQRFAPLATRADPGLIQAVIARLLEALESEKDVDGLVVLAPGLAALGSHMDPAQGSRVGEVILRALTADPHKLFLAGRAIEELARQISPEQSKRAVDLLLTRSLTRLGPELVWAQKAPVFAGSLTPELAGILVDDLTERLPKERDPSRILQQIQAALPFADELRPDQLQRLGDRLLQTLEATPNSYALDRLLLGMPWRGSAGASSPRAFIASEESALDIQALRGLCRALANLFPRMAEADAAELAGRLAWRFRQQGWSKPLPYDPQLAEALQYAPASSLASILRTPFGVGGLRQTALRALELKRDRRSTGLAADR